MTTGPMIDATVVENLILAAMIAAATPEGIAVFGPNEAPPSSDADMAGDTPIARWCRLNPIILTPADEDESEDGTDTAIATVTITVGVSDAVVDPAQGGVPTRLNADRYTIASAIHKASMDHAATTHRVRFKKATQRNEPIGVGGHEMLQTGIITANATVYRKTGRAAVLST